MPYKDPIRQATFKRQWAKDNPDKIRAAKIKYYQVHKEERKAYQVSYRLTGSGMVSVIKNHAKARGKHGI